MQDTPVTVPCEAAGAADVRTHPPVTADRPGAPLCVSEAAGNLLLCPLRQGGTTTTGSVGSQALGGSSAIGQSCEQKPKSVWGLPATTQGLFCWESPSGRQPPSLGALNPGVWGEDCT